MFLRINSKSGFWTSFPISAADCDFLDHDSFVELTNLVRDYASDIAGSDRLGRLSAIVAAALVNCVASAKTLSPDHKDLVIERLSGPDGPLQAP